MGLPGLPLAVRLEGAELLLVDRREGRTDWLRRAVGRLGLAARVTVVTANAGDLGWDEQWQGWEDRGGGPGLPDPRP